MGCIVERRLSRKRVLSAQLRAAALQGAADGEIGFQADRPHTVQASGLGAAYLAGLATGVWRSLDDVRHAWRSGRIFEPRWSSDERETRFKNWQRAIAAAREKIF
jgi:glycerol kinase